MMMGWRCGLCQRLSWHCVSPCSCKLALTNEVLLYILDISICMLSQNTLSHITGAFLLRANMCYSELAHSGKCQFYSSLQWSNITLDLLFLKEVLARQQKF